MKPPQPLDAGKTRFRKLIAAGPEAKPRLPQVHSTDTYRFEDVLTAGSLEPQECKVFTGELLTYLFYGRPAFRPNLDAEPSSLAHYFPVCLIFRPSLDLKIRRIFPFDSGAFENGFYGSFLHKKMNLEDFALEPDASTPGKLITRFFGSVSAYLRANPGTSPTHDPAQFEAQSYSALIHAREGNALDSRGSGVETQIDRPIYLDSAIQAVILPTSFAEGQTGETLQQMNIDMIPYRVYERSRPSEYMSEITTLCLSYYVRLGLIREDEL